MSAIENGSASTHNRSVRERDLDNFMIEELTASPSFREWLLQRLQNYIDVPVYSRATAGKNPNREAVSGQTDLGFVLWDDAGNEMVHILIEDKVALGFQPNQPERYAEEVAAARRRLGNRRAAAVLVAPSSNKAVLDNPNFDLSVRLEDIIAHLRQRRDDLSGIDNSLSEELHGRLSARIDLLDALSKKRGYNGNWTLTYSRTPRLHGSVPCTCSAAGTALQDDGLLRWTEGKDNPFHRSPIPGLSLRNIRHDFRGQVSLVLPRAGSAKRNLEQSGFLRMLTGAAIDVSKRDTLLIRLPSVPLDPMGEHFQQQIIEVEESIKAAIRLYDWAKSNAAALARVIGSG